MEKLVVEVLRSNKLDLLGSDPKTPVIIQSFSAESLKRFSTALPSFPLVLLIGEENKDSASPEGLKTAKMFAAGVSPSKQILQQNPIMVSIAHQLGLTVTVYTFRSDASGRFPSVREEMAYYLNDLGIDAVFTNNPDQFPR